MLRHSPRAHSDIEVVAVSDTPGLVALQPEWLALWERAAGATPFQSPDWQVPWWACFGTGQLLVLSLRHSGRLVGVAPFYIVRDRESGRRHLLLVGTASSDYLDVLLERESARDGAAAILDALAERADRWDVAELQQLRTGSALLAAPVPHDLTDVREAHDPCPVLALPRSPHELARVVPRRTLENLRYGRRRLERHGHAVVETATRDTLDHLLDALFALHGARWVTRGLPGVLSEDAVQDFHRRAARGLLERGVLRLYALRLNERPIALLYGFLHGGRAYYYIGGFDPAYARLSPGTLLIGHAIEEAIHAGAEEFDFLRGREPYKYRWGAADRPTWRRRLTPAAVHAAAAG
jgi:CelD/BcsL family acetyltransferase involved in cellulose biosynthesis